MSEQLGVLPASLRPRHESGDNESLTTILGRIYEERGHFRNISEAGLKAEIVARDNDDGASASEDAEEEEPAKKDNKRGLEELQAARREMIGHVASAHNEAMMAVDFVSLLISKDLPHQADMTMSPFLKQHIKPGTLGIDMWQNMPADTQREKTDALLARGTRLQSLQQSADSLLSAATRLEANVRKETAYWNEILSVSERGWSVCRMPREKHNLGVRYGFAESQGEFGRRGLAALRADEEGHVVLDRGFGNNPKAIRVRMQQGSDIVGSSKVPVLSDDSDLTVEARIRHARDSLFEEELFHELIRESRSLYPYGVKMDNGSIRIPSHTTNIAAESSAHALVIIVDLVSLEDSHTAESSGQEDQLSEAIALCFRLLLSKTHRERLERRSRIPPPLSMKKAETPLAQILRPVMAMLQHHMATNLVQSYLNRINATLSAASIACTVAKTTSAAGSLTDTQSINDLMDRLTQPMQSMCSLKLEPRNAHDSFECLFEVESALSAPTYGTKFNLYVSGQERIARFSKLEDLAAHLDYLLSNAIARTALPASGKEWAVDDADATLTRSGEVSDGGDPVVLEFLSGMQNVGTAGNGRLCITLGQESFKWMSDDSEGLSERQSFDEVVERLTAGK